MSPNLPSTASELASRGARENLLSNAPSLATNGTPGPSELNASLLTRSFVTASSARRVPAPNSAEVWAQGEASDHMILAKWSVGSGWEAPQLVPYGPLSLMPTASALHYATECFEGMKLYRGVDGRARLFRPDKNALRMLASAARISLPAFPPQQLVDLITELAAVDAPRWLPEDRARGFLYVRPTLIATMPSLAVKKPTEALLYIMLVCFPAYDEPGGSLGPPGTETGAGERKKVKRAGVRLFASEEDTVRAWPGGFGNSKLGANYGPSLVASAQAAERGYDQILWLFGKEGWVTEAGASNFFVVMKDKESGRTQLITAPLGDQIILPGVTRLSVLELAREMLASELDVVERSFTIHELIEAADEGRLIECFASGTAFFISAIGEIHYKGRDIEVPLGEDNIMGDYAKKLRGKLRSIMHGEVDHPWGQKIEERGWKVPK